MFVCAFCGVFVGLTFLTSSRVLFQNLNYCRFEKVVRSPYFCTALHYMRMMTIICLFVQSTRRQRQPQRQRHPPKPQSKFIVFRFLGRGSHSSLNSQHSSLICVFQKLKKFSPHLSNSCVSLYKKQKQSPK